MFKYDPYAPMARAEMADRHQWAAQQRLLRSARAREATDTVPESSSLPMAGLRWRVLRWIAARAVPNAQW